jgi:choline dehydrogenase
MVEAVKLSRALVQEGPLQALVIGEVPMVKAVHWQKLTSR